MGKSGLKDLTLKAKHSLDEQGRMVLNRISLILFFNKYSTPPLKRNGSLNCHNCFSITDGEGVHVGEDEVAGAVAAKGGLCLPCGRWGRCPARTPRLPW